jgi:hypothetical protein
MEDLHAPEKIKTEGSEETDFSKTKESFKKTIQKRKYLFIALGLISVISSLYLLLAHTTEYTASVLICPKVEEQVIEYYDTTGKSPVLIREHLASLPLKAYPAILRSPQIQHGIISDIYEIGYKYGKYRLNLMEYFALEDLAYAFGHLNQITEIEVDDNHSVVRLSVTTKFPDLSRQVLDNYIRMLKEYMTHQQSQPDENLYSALNQKLEYVYNRSSEMYMINISDFIEAENPAVNSSKDNLSSSFITVPDGFTKAASKPVNRSLALIPIVAGFLVIMFVVTILRNRKPEQADAESDDPNDLIKNLQFALEMPEENRSKSDQMMTVKAITLKRGEECTETPVGEKQHEEKQVETQEKCDSKQENQTTEFDKDKRQDLELAKIYAMTDCDNIVERPDRLNEEFLDIINAVEAGGEPETDEERTESSQVEIPINRLKGIEQDTKAKKSKSSAKKSESSKSKQSRTTKGKQTARKTSAKKSTAKQKSSTKAKSTAQKTARKTTKSSTTRKKTSRAKKVVT